MNTIKAVFVAFCTLAFATCATARAHDLHMQLVAQEDDDFLFMNPELQNDIAAGLDIVTVYVTSGEANGAGACTDALNFEAGRAEHALRTRCTVGTSGQVPVPCPALTNPMGHRKLPVCPRE